MKCIYSSVRLVDPHICKASTEEACLSMWGSLVLIIAKQVHIKCIYSNVRLINPHICKASTYEWVLMKQVYQM
ncbi:hypothetical protein M422DRAFT_275116 [Sphaerobolus stellatus SS14]|uniref:Unplaced genomic scaffold SPHSTscaffold_448, whole genome shotgun sequence n=1 Tax=Sphaerobolus stellatus (strain SS14) TaxID=990650 RepID=A0A0C9TQD9_SPHS4|nr:hypothetical protein M422DRAFT_275116 [Sphaerobolus stellatus SS14]